MQPKYPEYIDVHAHVNFADYDADRAEVIQRSLDAGVWMINVGTNLESSREVVTLAEKYEQGVYAIVGLHPTNIASANIGSEESEYFDYDAFEKLVAHPKVVGIGECGIDVFRLDPNEDKERVLKKQEEVFRKQIELAIRYNKPIMIHARESYSKILEIIDDVFMVTGIRLRGNAHFFVGTTDEARAFLQRGFTVSFTGVITFASVYKELVQAVPLESMLSETDCPFVAPVPYRGKRNEPVYVREVVQKIAEIKDLSLEEVKKGLLLNAFKQFGLS